MFVRLSGALLIIISCAGFGYCINLRNKIKINELNNFKQCLNCLENEMCVSYKTLQEALDEAFKLASTLNKYFLKKFLNVKNEAELPDSNIYNSKDLCVLKELHSITEIAILAIFLHFKPFCYEQTSPSTYLYTPSGNFRKVCKQTFSIQFVRSETFFPISSKKGL